MAGAVFYQFSLHLSFSNDIPELSIFSFVMQRSCRLPFKY